jgi:hypothetical protein
MSQEFQDMGVDDLVGLLSHHTARFTHLMMDRQFDEEYNNCKAIIKELQETITIKGTIPNSLLDN